MKERDYIDLSGCSMTGENMRDLARDMKNVLTDLMVRTSDTNKVQTNAIGSIFKALDYLEHVEYI